MDVIRCLKDVREFGCADLREGKTPDSSDMSNWHDKDVTVWWDTEHANLRNAHCTVAAELLHAEFGPQLGLMTLSGDVILAIDVEDRKTVLMVDGVERLAIADPNLEMDTASYRYAQCTHQPVHPQIRAMLGACHAAGSVPGTSYPDAFLGLWLQKAASVVFRPVSAARRQMKPYLLYSDALGYKIGVISEVGVSQLSLQEALDLLSDPKLRDDVRRMMVMRSDVFNNLSLHFADAARG